MMKMILGLLIATSAHALSLPLTAPTDVACWDDDCLHKGWTIQHAAGRVTESECRDAKCDAQGWIANGNAGIGFYVRCKDDGCLKEGWYEVELLTQRLLRDVVCESGADGQTCLEYGWTAYDRAAGVNYRTTCQSNDCATQGWDTILPGYRLVAARCLKGGCFSAGWKER